MRIRSESSPSSDLDTARAEAASALAELDEVRVAGDRWAEQARSAEVAALMRVEEAERGREQVARELMTMRATKGTAVTLGSELEGVRGRGSWWGMLLRLAGSTRTHKARMVLIPVLVGMVAGCAAAPGPPFDLTSERPAKVLDMIKWLGSLQDLSQTAVVTSGLGLSPSPRVNFVEQDGKRVPNSISFLDYVPLAEMPNSRMGYSMFDPQGPAALSRRLSDPENVIRANVDFMLNEGEVCLKKSDFVDRFGEPIHTFLITDGGEHSYFWLIGSEGKWKTYMYAPFRNDETACTNIIGIWQKTGGDIRG